MTSRTMDKEIIDSYYKKGLELRWVHGKWAENKIKRDLWQLIQLLRNFLVSRMHLNGKVGETEAQPSRGWDRTHARMRTYIQSNPAFCR